MNSKRIDVLIFALQLEAECYRHSESILTARHL